MVIVVGEGIRVNVKVRAGEQQEARRMHTRATPLSDMGLPTVSHAQHARHDDDEEMHDPICSRNLLHGGARVAVAVAVAVAAQGC